MAYTPILARMEGCNRKPFVEQDFLICAGTQVKLRDKNAKEYGLQSLTPMAKMISYLRQKVGPSVMEKARVSSLSLGHPTTVS